MTKKQCHSNFVFSETNFYNNTNYQSLFFNPLSFENGMFFWMNLPGLFYAGMLIERFVGPGALIGAYLLNCGVSGLTTAVYHRQMGW